MILIDEIDAILRRRGYRVIHETLKKRCLQKGSQNPVYLNLTSKNGETGLIAHPSSDIAASSRNTPGVRVGDSYYHSSNMRHFPQRMHRGQNPICYGWGCSFETAQALEATLDILEGKPALTSASPMASAPSLLAVPMAGFDESVVGTRRIGHEQFRNALLQHWAGCAVTGLKTAALLRASHIKPWKDATPVEKTDLYNGLLLAPQLDAAFDAGLISFQDDGQIVLSPRLSLEDANLLGIHRGLRLRTVATQHTPYLRFHRQVVFAA